MADNERPLNAFTPIGVVSFPNLWVPKAFQEGDPEYSCNIIFGEDGTVDFLSREMNEINRRFFQELRVAIRAAAIKRFGDNYKAKGITLRSPLRKTEEYARYGEPYTTIRNGYFCRVATRDQPGIVDADSHPILNKTDIFSGCLGRASVYCHAYDTKGNKGVKLLLNNFQKAGEWKRLSGRLDAEQEFDRLETVSTLEEDDI